jgi:hypothetical protein
MEKTGNTEKIKYDFNTAANLEIWMPNLKDWYRVIPREFRSFNGKRRINYEEYNGDIYHYESNKRADLLLYPLDKIVEYKWRSVRRPGD